MLVRVQVLVLRVDKEERNARYIHDSWLHCTGRFGGKRKDSGIEVGGGGEWERMGGETNRVKP